VGDDGREGGGVGRALAPVGGAVERRVDKHADAVGAGGGRRAAAAAASGDERRELRADAGRVAGRQPAEEASEAPAEAVDGGGAVAVAAAGGVQARGDVLGGRQGGGSGDGRPVVAIVVINAVPAAVPI